MIYSQEGHEENIITEVKVILLSSQIALFIFITLFLFFLCLYFLLVTVLFLNSYGRTGTKIRPKNKKKEERIKA